MKCIPDLNLGGQLVSIEDRLGSIWNYSHYWEQTRYPYIKLETGLTNPNSRPRTRRSAEAAALIKKQF